VRKNTGGCFCLHIDKRRRRCYNADNKKFSGMVLHFSGNPVLMYEGEHEGRW
jgi:hypothetical protein